MDEHLLSTVLFTPLVGLAILMFIPRSQKTLIKVWANLVAFVGFLVAIPLILTLKYDKTRLRGGADAH